MHMDEIRAKGSEELREELQASYRELMNLRVQWTTRQLTSYGEIKKVRTKIARMQTLLRARELGIE